MKPKKGAEITLKIDSLVYGGSGIGQVDGYKVFVDGVAPGDSVRAQMKKARTSYGEGRLLQILEPSPLRIQARCKHFGVCGGCKWQFLDYGEQCKVKEQQVKDAMERIGGLGKGDSASPSVVKPLIPNREPWFYRNKMELSFGTSPDGKVMLGFYPTGYHYEVFDVEECFLQSELLVEIVKKVRDFAKEFRVPVYNSHTHEGLLRTLTVREGKNTGEVMVILTTSTSVFDHKEAFAKLFEGDERITSLYWNTVYQVPGHPTWQEENLLAGKEVLTEALILENGQRLEFDILPQAFFQTNTKQAEVLYSKVVELAGLSGEEVVFDLYCGTGTIGLFCAHKARHIYGIEVNEAAVESARGNASKNKIENATFFLGSVEERLAELKEKPDVLIVDPPRAGLEGDVVEKCAAFGADKIVYVSCNPSTLARDLKAFTGLGYAIITVQPVDMFPQTHHTECVTLLEKNA
ncbi:23S rRNA (uracil-5-)-methyltransferase RumA [Candidatus Peregrinibacteria bacterium RIFCSPLOWO2_01_FULL_48_20]|nr:MAG: 23S rRNA (uracil-5-)-methyltransferase RumA [Candidatus Peregrinibacteria bacterium RIFCSPLOWO2_01_FULL_48_20]